MSSDPAKAAKLTAAAFEADLEPLRTDEHLAANGGDDEAASGGGP
ncbi:hypothetical protein [Halostagnicola sp. A-GB9-2]|nr:hypothetical protein [Halostagnicola sp. A-GB9-2]MDJ1434699.1 hypothetical protein [Halostagnicola sp. A-GB9-2]